MKKLILISFLLPILGTAILLLFSGSSIKISSATILPQDYPLRQITKNPANDYHVKCSPDGKTIAFSSTRAGNTDVWVKNVK